MNKKTLPTPKTTWRSIVWAAAKGLRHDPTPSELYPRVLRLLETTPGLSCIWSGSETNRRAKVRQVLGELRAANLFTNFRAKSFLELAADRTGRNPWQIRDAQRRLAGTCISCADPAIPGTGRCSYHREYSRQNCKQWGRKTNHGADATKLRFYRTSGRKLQLAASNAARRGSAIAALIPTRGRS